MGELKTVYPEGKLSFTDLKLNDVKNTIPPDATNVLEVKTANEWIEKAKKNQFRYHLWIVYGTTAYSSNKNISRLRRTFQSKYKKHEAGYNS